MLLNPRWDAALEISRRTFRLGLEQARRLAAIRARAIRFGTVEALTDDPYASRSGFCASGLSYSSEEFIREASAAEVKKPLEDRAREEPCRAVSDEEELAQSPAALAVERR